MSAYKIARLKAEQAKTIQKLEAELDVCIIAMEPGLALVELSEEQLAKIKEAEKALGATLIVYKDC